jgi:hypothetical protein
VPTIHPRYTVTDTGDVRQMLDLAERRWPEVKDRRLLLLRLARIGRDAIGPQTAAAERARVRELQLAAIGRAGRLVDASVLLDDAAWR